MLTTVYDLLILFLYCFIVVLILTYCCSSCVCAWNAVNSLIGHNSVVSLLLSCTDAAKHAPAVTSDVAATLLQLISQQASDSRRAPADPRPSSPLSATPPPASSPAAATETQFTQDQDLRYTLGGAAGPSWNVALNFIFWLLSFFLLNVLYPLNFRLLLINVFLSSVKGKSEC